MFLGSLFFDALGFDTSRLSHLFGAFLLSIDVMDTASIFRRVLTGGYPSNPFAVSQLFSTFAFVILCCGCLVKSFCGVQSLLRFPYNTFVLKASTRFRNVS